MHAKMRNALLGLAVSVHNGGVIKNQWPDEFQPLVRKRLHH